MFVKRKTITFFSVALSILVIDVFALTDIHNIRDFVFAEPSNEYALYFDNNHNYDLDIDVNGSYSLNIRQVGRVVVWEYDFSCYSDGSVVAPVCVYTDDHYATFQEYNCMGGFASRFNSERSVVNKVYTPLTAI